MYQTKITNKINLLFLLFPPPPILLYKIRIKMIQQRVCFFKINLLFNNKNQATNKLATIMLTSWQKTKMFPPPSLFPPKNNKNNNKTKLLSQRRKVQKMIFRNKIPPPPPKMIQK